MRLVTRLDFSKVVKLVLTLVVFTVANMVFQSVIFGLICAVLLFLILNKVDKVVFLKDEIHADIRNKNSIDLKKFELKTIKFSELNKDDLKIKDMN